MSTVSAGTARNRASRYRDRLEGVRNAVRRDMEHMNLENVNRRDEMDELAAQIQNECRIALQHLNALIFENE